MATQNVCNWNKYGFCKHGERCRKLHVKEVCEKPSCTIVCCLKRHPKQCKFFSNHKMCKFDPCAFLHVENTDTFEYLKNENEVILLKINDVNISIKALEEKELETKTIIDKLMEVEKKLEIFTYVRQHIHAKDEVIDQLIKKVTEMEVNLKEKDDLINNLVKRVKIVEVGQNSLGKETEKEDLKNDKKSESDSEPTVLVG